MKKTIVYSAACLLFAACVSTELSKPNPSGGVTFEKGQKVIIGMSAPSTKAISEIGSTQVRFLWEEEDSVQVKVGKAKSTFRLKGGAGSSSATFEGTMPEGGSSFSVQYPFYQLNLKNQRYNEGHLPDSMLVFSKKNCTLDEDIVLEVQNAAMCIPLYGSSKTVGQICLNLIAIDETRVLYLHCDPGKTVGTTSDTATPFYMVVPAYQQFEDMRIEVYEPGGALIKKIRGSDKYFEKSKLYDLPPLSLD